MNDLDETQFKMMLNTAKTMDRFKYVWIDNPTIVDCNEILTVNIRQVRLLNKDKRKSPKGITIIKGSSRVVLTKEVFSIKQSLRMYYLSKQLDDEAKLLSYPKSSLIYLSDNDFYMAASYVQQKAVELGAKLLPFGTTQAQIDLLTINLEEFHLILPKLKLAIINKTKGIKKTTSIIKNCVTMLHNILNNAVDVYADTNPDFHKSYYLSRRRVPKPGKHATYMVTIFGKVTDSITKEAIIGVKVEAGDNKQVTTTDKDGNYSKKIYKKYAKTVTFSLSGKYQDLTLNIPDKYIKERVEVNAELHLIPSNNI